MRWILALAMLISTFALFIPLRFGYYRPVSKAEGLVYKVIPTLLCAAFAGYALRQNGSRYALFLFLGLMVCAAADVMLRIHLPAGGGLFFLGHVLYVTALTGLMTPAWHSLPVFLAAFAVLFSFAGRYRQRIGKAMMGGVCLYCAALASLLAFALPLPFHALSRRTLLAAVGALLFAISDMATCHVLVMKPKDGWHWFSLGTYYTAQLLLGLSAF